MYASRVTTAAPTEPRQVCTRCERPVAVCWCAHLPSLETRTRVVVLQHPRERHMPIGTARMATLCLSNAEIHSGVRFAPEVLQHALGDPARPAVLLYPGEGAVDIRAQPPRQPVTLVVLDGTWFQARKLLRENPELAALPRYAFQPTAPSEYRIRKEPQPTYTSTIEALAYALGPLEGDAERFRTMLEPFRAMVEMQLSYQAQPGGSRHRRTPRAERPPPRPPAILRERFADLVCVVAEANAWPYRSEQRNALYPDELVQWTAYRVASGEVFDVVTAPHNPLAPETTEHTWLSREELEGGTSLDDLHARWRGFAREGDVICTWGHYGPALFRSSGGWLPSASVELREVARALARGKVGSLDEVAMRLGIDGLSPRRGRGAARVDTLVRLVRHLALHEGPPAPGWARGA